MASELIISISGVRGIIGENLNPMIASEYACAFGTYLSRECKTSDRLRVSVGRDSRPSGQMLLSAVTAGLTAAGVDVIDLGIVTTPCVGIMVRHLGCDGGVVITASHNPTPYNGIKLLFSNGMAPPADQAGQIRDAYFAEQFELRDATNCGKVSVNQDVDDIHIEKVLATVDMDAIRKNNYKVVLDSVNGAGGRIGKRLLEELGCTVIGMNLEATGLFAHTPEPTKDNLGDLCTRVATEKADVGFAQDPDADRVAIVDENGHYIGEEYSLAFAAELLLGANQGGKAAANLSTSRMIDDVAKKYAGRVIRTPVGEANVADAMMREQCIIGGEGNGGIIDLRVGPVRDSLVGMALCLQLMTRNCASVSSLVNEMGSYYMHKTKVGADKEQAAAIIGEVQKKFPDARLNTSDGARFDFADGWVHLRTSNTEPVMRIIVETDTQESAKRYLAVIDEIRADILG